MMRKQDMDPEALRKLSVKDAMMLLDGLSGALEHIICQLSDTEDNSSTLLLKTYLSIHVYRPLKEVVKHYDKKLNGIYTP